MLRGPKDDRGCFKSIGLGKKLAVIIYTYEDPVSERDLAKLVKCLNEDGVIAYPTDVNWAFGAKATSKKGLSRIKLLKPAHPKEQPFSLIFHDIRQVSDYAQIDGSAYRVLKKTLPGPYTIILPRSRSLPKQLDDKRDVVGIRVPARPLLRELVERLQVPLATTSCPDIDGKSPIYGYQVDEVFGHGLDYIADLGLESQGGETTVFEMLNGELNVIRQGLGPIDPLV